MEVTIHARKIRSVWNHRQKFIQIGLVEDSLSRLVSVSVLRIIVNTTSTPAPSLEACTAIWPKPDGCHKGRSSYRLLGLANRLYPKIDRIGEERCTRRPLHRGKAAIPTSSPQPGY